jgi:hypothetical protein
LASWNLQRFYDAHDDPTLDEPVLPAEAWQRRKGKFLQLFQHLAPLPQVLLMQEVEASACQELAEELGKLAQARSGESYSCFFSPPQDGTGLGLGLLWTRGGPWVQVEVQELTPILQREKLANPDGSQSPLFDRPPLFARLSLRLAGSGPWEIALLGVHVRSMNGLLSTNAGSAGWPTEGARVREKRARQAEALASWIEGFQGSHPQVPLLVMGDFNAFEFSDGVVDVVGTIAGHPSSQVVRPTADLVSRDLLVLTSQEPAPQRYSYVYDGSAQALDHVLVSTHWPELGLEMRLWRPRVAADWPEVWRASPGPMRLSDHDPLFLSLSVRSPRRKLPHP